MPLSKSGNNFDEAAYNPMSAACYHLTLFIFLNQKLQHLCAQSIQFITSKKYTMSKKEITLFCLLCIGSQSIFAQNIFGRIKQKATDIVEKAVDKKTDKLLNNQTAQQEKSKNGTQTENKRALSQDSTEYDFEPGSKVLLKEDFSQDVIGQFPLQWYTKSKGEIVTLKDIPGKWLRLYNGVFLSPATTLKENYTVEFDLIINFPINGGYLVPELNIGLYDRGNKGFILTNEYGVKNNVRLNLFPYRNDMLVKLVSNEDSRKKLETDKYVIQDFIGKVGIPIHVAMDIQKERIRVWIDKEKVFDLPSAVPLSNALNQMRIEMMPSNYKNNELGYYISNLRFTEGKADTRSKLLTEGKLESNAILFATNSAEIKSDEQGVIQEVADAMKQDTAMRIKVIGHTDSDGRGEANLTLSHMRAKSVKKQLIEKYGIAEDRIETYGKGDTQPVAQDTTPEGKSKNRRVEFVGI